MTSSEQTAQSSRVEQWIGLLQEEGNELHQDLAENFVYYLDHVDEVENGTLQFSDLPKFNDADKAVIHIAAMFGLSWAKDSDVHVVTDEENRFIMLFGIVDNAESVIEGEEGLNLLTVTPIGKDPFEEVNDIKNSETDLMQQTGECLEHLLENEEAFENEKSEEVVDSMPHFESNTKWLIAFSALFGKIWEYSDPALWVVLTESEGFEGLFADPKLAAEKAANLPNGRTERITPEDNRKEQTELPLN